MSTVEDPQPPHLICTIPDGTTDFILNCSSGVDPLIVVGAATSLLAALGTLGAVWLSYHFGRKAQKNADEQVAVVHEELGLAHAANKKLEEREALRDKRDNARVEAEQRRHAEQVVAWLTPKGAWFDKSSITVANHSEFPIWNVVVPHRAFGSTGQVIIPVLAAGNEYPMDIGSWARARHNPNDNILLAENIKVTFTDHQLRSWTRYGGENPRLIENKERSNANRDETA